MNIASFVLIVTMNLQNGMSFPAAYALDTNENSTYAQAEKECHRLGNAAENQQENKSFTMTEHKCIPTFAFITKHAEEIKERMGR